MDSRRHERLVCPFSLNITSEIWQRALKKFSIIVNFRILQNISEYFRIFQKYFRILFLEQIKVSASCVGKPMIEAYTKRQDQRRIHNLAKHIRRRILPK